MASFYFNLSGVSLGRSKKRGGAGLQDCSCRKAGLRDRAPPPVQSTRTLWIYVLPTF